MRKPAQIDGPQISVGVMASQKAWLDKESERRQISVADIMREALREKMKRAEFVETAAALREWEKGEKERKKKRATRTRT